MHCYCKRINVILQRIGRDFQRYFYFFYSINISKDITFLIFTFFKNPTFQGAEITLTGPRSSFYYSCQLANHNFTVTELESMLAHCFFWSEKECQKGSYKVASSLERFLSKKNEVGLNKFHFFSDRCSGQNNNRMIFVMLNATLHDLNLESVRLTYLISGHSQSENDTAHSVIENMANGKIVYTTLERVAYTN